MANATETPNISELSQEELNSRTQTMVGLPLGLRLAIREFGANQNPKMSEAAVMRNGIASFVGYELPAKAERVTGYTDEQKKAAQKARQKERRQKLAATLKRFSVPSVEGAEDDDDEDDDDGEDEAK